MDASGQVAATREALLDAARGAVLAHGIRRTTVTDIARAGGVSRQTVYRYWPDVSALYAEVLTRDLLRALARPVAEPTLDALVTGLVHAGTLVRDLPLLRRIRETDPDMLARYVFERLGASQREILDRLAAVISDAQRLGIVRDGPVERLSAMVLLIVQSAVVSAPLVAEPLPPGAWDEELAVALRGYLAPASTHVPLRAASEGSNRHELGHEGAGA